MIKNWTQRYLSSNKSKNFTWKTLGTFQLLIILCQRIISALRCRNITVGLIVQNSAHRYVKFNHRLCKIHRSPASIVNNVFLLMTSRTNKTIFQFLSYFMHLYSKDCLFFKHSIAFFFLFQLIPKSVSTWFCSKCPLFVPYSVPLSTAALAATHSEIPVITESFLFIWKTW